MKQALFVVARGISQIFFIDNPLTGALIAIALAVVDPRLALLAIFGSAIQALGGEIMGLKEDTRQGMMGYNGALVGTASGLFVGYGPLAFALTLVGALACVIIHQALGGFISKYGLPVSTAPFCAVSSIIFGVLGSQVENAPLSHAPGVNGLGLGLANSFSEVVLADGLIPGIIILIALFLGSWRIGLWGLFGAAVELAITSAVHGIDEVSTGLYSYSAVLISIAFGAVLWPERPLVIRGIAAMIGVLLTLPIQAGLALTPIPVFTWPFVVAMWIILLASSLDKARKKAETAPAS